MAMDIEMVFLSHATEDRSIADKVREFLEQHRIRVWLAPEDIPIGSPNWDENIRKTMESAVTGLILIATPKARLSRFVRGELGLAEKYGRTIYPLWADGDDYRDTVPLGYDTIQRYDIRGEKFDTGMRQFLAHFSGLVGPETRIALMDRNYDKDRQIEERRAIFETFRDRVKAVWGSSQVSWTERFLKSPEILDACSGYLDEMAQFERRWGDRLLPDNNSLTKNMTSIVLGLQKALRDEEASLLTKVAMLMKYGGQLITEFERHWGPLGGTADELK